IRQPAFDLVEPVLELAQAVVLVLLLVLLLLGSRRLFARSRRFLTGGRRRGRLAVLTFLIALAVLVSRALLVAGGTPLGLQRFDPLLGGPQPVEQFLDVEIRSGRSRRGGRHRRHERCR